MLKLEHVAREDLADDIWHVVPDGVEYGKRINLSAIQDYAALGLKPPAISSLMGLGRNVIYQSTPLRAAYEKGRAVLNMHVMERAIRNMDSPAVMGKFMDMFGTGDQEPTATSSEDDQTVDVKISFPKRPTGDQK